MLYFSITDDLVCLNQKCTNDVCGPIGYEVCSEHPNFGKLTSRHICYALFIVNEDTLKSMYYCFNDEDSHCAEECKPAQHLNTTIYDCCCIGNMCNNVTLDLSGLTLLFVYVRTCVCILTIQVM